MLNKALTQLATVTAAFFLTWYGLSHIDFINDDQIEAITQEKEKQLGKLVLESITRTRAKIENEQVVATIDSIKHRICGTEFINCNDIKIHIIRSAEINAFALPDNHIVIYTGLLEYAENAEELAGVLAHEIGHLEKNHVMKKLVKEIGIEMLFAMVGGDAGFEIIKLTGKTLSSSAFDRAQEEEADNYAVETLAQADVDPQHLSNLFFRLSQDTDIPRSLSWLSTHPHSTDRAAAIIKKKKNYSYTVRRLPGSPWSEFKKMLSPASRGGEQSEDDGFADLENEDFDNDGIAL